MHGTNETICQMWHRWELVPNPCFSDNKPPVSPRNDLVVQSPGDLNRLNAVVLRRSSANARRPNSNSPVADRDLRPTAELPELRYGRDRVERRPHLREDFVEPLQRPVEMDLNPARRACDVLPMVLGAPTFHETHSDRAHLGQLEDGAVAVVY